MADRKLSFVIPEFFGIVENHYFVGFQDVPSDGGTKIWFGGFKKSTTRQNQCAGGPQFASDRQTYWFLSLQEAMERQED